MTTRATVNPPARYATAWITRALVVAACCLALAVAMSWPVPLHPASTMLDAFGDPLLNAWILAWDADRALHGFRDYWTGLFFFPYPDTVAYSEHLLGIALFTAPIQWLTGNAVLAYNAAFIVVTALAAAAAWLLARDVCGRDDVAFVAATAFACAPYRVPHAAHLQVLASGWIPLSLWALTRYLRTGRRRWITTWAAAFLLNATSNGYYLFFACVPTAMLLVHHTWTDRERRWPTLRDVAVASGVVLTAMLPILLAYVRVRREQGLARSLADIVHLSADLRSYAAASDRLWLWGGLLPASPPELALFPGLGVIALAAIALLPARRGGDAPPSTHARPARLYAAIVLAAVLLSLGPRPRLFGWMSPAPGPYELLLLIPGVDGLRVPARLNVIVSLGLAVLAALGVERLTRGASGRRQWAIACGCAAMVLVEGYPRPLTATRVPSTAMAADRAAYEWLRDQPPGPMLELPIGDTPTRVRYLFSTLLHGHRIVNGYSGYGSALQGFIEFPFADLARLDEALGMAQALGVRYVAVHPRLYGHDLRPGADLIRALRSSSRVSRLEEFGTMAIAAVRPGPAPELAFDPRWKAIPASAFNASVSDNPELLPLAFDGDPQTRWSTGGGQSGTEWITLSFDSPRDVAAVRIESNRRILTDYPRGLVVAGAEDGVSFAPLFEGPVADRLALDIVRDGAHPSIDLPLPPNTTRVLRLAVTGRTRRLHWSVAELRVWERVGTTAPESQAEAAVPGTGPAPATRGPVRP